MRPINNPGDYYLPPIPPPNPKPTPPAPPSFPPVTPSTLSLADQVSAVDTFTGLLTTLATVGETHYGAYSSFTVSGENSSQTSDNASLLSSLAAIKEGVDNKTMTLSQAQFELGGICQTLGAPELDLSSDSSVTDTIQGLVTQIGNAAVAHSTSDGNSQIQTAVAQYSQGQLTPNQMLQQIGDNLNDVDYKYSFHKVAIPFSAPEIPTQWDASLPYSPPPPSDSPFG